MMGSARLPTRRHIPGYLELTVLCLIINPLTLELNPSAQAACRYFLLGILIFKEVSARCLYKSFGVKGLKLYSAVQSRTDEYINVKLT
jgi:hypothetical protein